MDTRPTTLLACTFAGVAQGLIAAILIALVNHEYLPPAAGIVIGLLAGEMNTFLFVAWLFSRRNSHDAR